MTASERLPGWRRVTDAEDSGPGLEMTVGGTPVWWASRDATLHGGPEPALVLLAPWYAREGRRPELPSLDGTLLSHVAEATAAMGEWWGHPGLSWTGGADGTPPPPRPGTALFFSGGIDSFYSLVNNPDVQTLVHITGFDVRLARRNVAAQLARSFRELAAEQGKRFISLATNVRDHPMLGTMRWARFHGAVLACAAHLLRGVASRWLVSASYHHSNLMPWGSHPALDPLWSGAGLEFVHFGADVWRAEKLKAMHGEPGVHRRLRVCYADPSVAGDCGRCEKCVRTRLIYWQDLPGMQGPGLPDVSSLPAALAAIPRLEMRTLVRIYQRFLERAPAHDPVTTALAALIMRSQQGGLMRTSYGEAFGVRGLRYEQSMARNPDVRREEFGAMATNLSAIAGEHVVDAPSGGGYLRNYLPTSVRYTAVDEAPDFHRACLRRLSPPDLALLASCQAVPLAEAQASAVVSLAGLHHHHVRRPVFSEWFRLLAPGGRVVLADVAEGTSLGYFLNGFVDRYNSLGHDGRFLTGDDEDALTECGFEAVNRREEHYAWHFRDRGHVEDFCRDLFGLDRRGFAPALFRALRTELGLDETASGWVLPWGLRYLIARKPLLAEES